ncbi:late embryogenesis abundant protein D-34-like [Curcuma longa]|uniref:late embryogenesis abundant protein D-34-like n=1 Tax=Curcuma longa TaxID=136217 RepID=UPI003D9E802A
MSEGEPRRPATGPDDWLATVQGRDEVRRPGAVVGHVALWTDKITMGEALEAAVQTVGDEPVQGRHVDTVAVAEACATGLNVVVPGGLADSARLAADANAVVTRDDLKTTVGDVLGDAVARIPADKEVTAEDAARVASAEIRIGGDVDKRPGRVADSVAAAARLNECP